MAIIITKGMTDNGVSYGLELSGTVSAGGSLKEVNFSSEVEISKRTKVFSFREDEGREQSLVVKFDRVDLDRHRFGFDLLG